MPQLDMEVVGETTVQDQEEKRSPLTPVKGLTVVTTIFFILGEMAGSGVLALPRALADTGWIGLLVISIACLAAAITGVRLGACWNIMRERWVEYQGHVRYPYPAIAERAYGKWARFLVTSCINITLFGAATVYLLIAAENIQDFVKEVTGGKDISFCYWSLVVAGLLVPFLLLGTPKDFWPVAIGATAFTFIACIFIILQTGIDSSKAGFHLSEVKRDPPKVELFFLAFGTISFAFGGHSIFPTIQSDMREPQKFSLTVAVSLSLLLLLYLPVAAATYAVYGSDVKSNVISSLGSGVILYICQVLITLHLLFAISIILNPIGQLLENIFKVPPEFNWKRVVIRLLLLASILFTAETIPHFGYLLSLVGGSSTALLVFVFPPLFYMRLRSMEGDWVKVPVPLFEKIMYSEIIVLGLMGGGGATYAAVKSIVGPNTFTPPCYVDMKAAEAP